MPRPGASYKPAKESWRAVAAYKDFVEMGSGRTLVALGKKYEGMIQAGDKPPCTNIARIKVWSAVFGWSKRIEEIELRQARQAEDEQQRLWEQRRETHREKMITVGAQLLAKGEEMLKFPVAQRTQTTKGENGEEVTITLMPARWSFDTAAKFVDVADKLIRLAAEMETSREAVTIEEVSRVASQVGVSNDDLMRLAGAVERGDDVASLAEEIARGRRN